MTEISVGFTIVVPGSLDPDMHFGLEVKWLTQEMQNGWTMNIKQNVMSRTRIVSVGHF